MKKTFNEQLMEECNVLELLENSNDESQQKAIISMLCDMVKYLNHKGGQK